MGKVASTDGWFARVGSQGGAGIVRGLGSLAFVRSQGRTLEERSQEKILNLLWTISGRLEWVLSLKQFDLLHHRWVEEARRILRTPAAAVGVRPRAEDDQRLLEVLRRLGRLAPMLKLPLASARGSTARWTRWSWKPSAHTTLTPGLSASGSLTIASAGCRTRSGRRCRPWTNQRTERGKRGFASCHRRSPVVCTKALS
jgi:hypothetical protein